MRPTSFFIVLNSKLSCLLIDLHARSCENTKTKFVMNSLWNRVFIQMIFKKFTCVNDSTTLNSIRFFRCGCFLLIHSKLCWAMIWVRYSKIADRQHWMHSNYFVCCVFLIIVRINCILIGNYKQTTIMYCMYHQPLALQYFCWFYVVGRFQSI